MEQMTDLGKLSQSYRISGEKGEKSISALWLCPSKSAEDILCVEQLGLKFVGFDAQQNSLFIKEA